MIKFNIETQPTDETCGPTCLHGIYHYFGKDISLSKVISTVERSQSGGTLSPLLGKHALNAGFNATIYVNNLTIFDPTWFRNGQAPREVLWTKLHNQRKFKQGVAFSQASDAFEEFLKLGGNIRFQTIDVHVLNEYFDRGLPILTGLNATYLYRTPRESFTSDGQSFFDDMQGMPCGHFVVLCGYDEKKNLVRVADPFRNNPFAQDNYYYVTGTRLINAIMLGILSYDASLLIIEHKKEDTKGKKDTAQKEVKKEVKKLVKTAVAKTAKVAVKKTTKSTPKKVASKEKETKSVPKKMVKKEKEMKSAPKKAVKKNKEVKSPVKKEAKNK